MKYNERVSRLEERLDKIEKRIKEMECTPDQKSAIEKVIVEGARRGMKLAQTLK